MPAESPTPSTLRHSLAARLHTPPTGPTSRHPTLHLQPPPAGLVWVKLQPFPHGAGSAATTSDIPTLPELDDDSWLGFGDMFRDLPYDYATLLENVLDAGGWWLVMMAVGNYGTIYVMRPALRLRHAAGERAGRRCVVAEMVHNGINHR